MTNPQTRTLTDPGARMPQRTLAASAHADRARPT